MPLKMTFKPNLRLGKTIAGFNQEMQAKKRTKMYIFGPTVWNSW